ncbi:helix-turn-helix domain-containing protein [bacterium]|nr:helix-turn-helix domain-containing protein [bacterium]
MPPAIQPDPRFGDADAVQAAIRKTRDADHLVRLQAIRHRLLGKTVRDVCELLSIQSSTLRNWVHRWNEGGIEALRTRPRSGRPRKIDPDFKDLVVERIGGIDEDGKPWSAIAIHGYLKKTPWK